LYDPCIIRTVYSKGVVVQSRQTSEGLLRAQLV